MKRIYLSIIIIFVLSLNIFGQENLQLNILIPKNVYLLNEPIEIGYSIHNKGANVKNNISLQNRVYLKLINESPNVLPKDKSTEISLCPSKSDLQPGDENYATTSLTSFLGKMRPLANFYIPVGRYNLKAYLLKFSPEREIIDSADFHLQIIEPSGTDLVVYNEYIDALTNIITAEECAKKLRYLADTYPNSIYLPVILNRMYNLLAIWVKDKDHAKEVKDEIIDKCPNSQTTYALIKSKLQSIDDKEKRKEFLKKYSLRNKNLIYQKKIDELLKEQE
jgi:hypothetical protein